MSDLPRWERLAADFTAATEEFMRGPTPARLEKLQALRLQAVSELLELAEPIGPARASVLGKILLGCMQSGLRTFRRTDLEQERLTHCVERMRATDYAEAPCLAALLLASHAVEIPWLPDIATLSPATRPLWLELLLQRPEAVQRAGDNERYAEYLRRLCERLHQYLDQVGHAPADVATALLKASSVASAYHSELNLRPLMRMKAALVERILEGSEFVLEQLRVMRPHRARPRIGFLAFHLGGSTDTVFIAAHMERLDRRRFEVRLYCTDEPTSPVGALCRASAEHFVLLPGDIAAAVSLLRREDLDVAVFCCNMTLFAHKLVQIGAHRIARLQVANGSSPVTTGLRNMDFLVQGEANETEDSQEHYTERLARIRGAADCYPFQYVLPGEALQPAPRSAFGFPEGSTVYFSSANYFKLVPELTRTWVSILARVPNSYLLLMPFNPNWSNQYATQPLFQRLFDQAAAAGIAPNRIRVQQAVPEITQLHAIMGAVDVYLDSFPYTGACSYFDALTSGLPVVARRGRVNRSRHGSAILEQEGFPDWVADDEAGYISRAVALGTDPEKRRSDRERLLQARNNGLKLTDTANYAARFMPLLDELLESWDRHVAALHALPPSELPARIASQARAVAGKRASFFEADLLAQVIFPYLSEGSRRLIHVGFRNAALRPFLDQRWQVLIFEPDLQYRAELSELEKRNAGQVRVEPSSVGAEGELPGAVSLGAYIRRKGLFDVDYIGTLVPGRGFAVMQTIDFAEAKPRLMTMSFDERSAGQDREAIESHLAYMRERGYRACVVRLRTAGESRSTSEKTHLLAIGIDAVPRDAEPLPLLGSLVFFRAEDADFLPSLADWLARLQ